MPRWPDVFWQASPAPFATLYCSTPRRLLSHTTSRPAISALLCTRQCSAAELPSTVVNQRGSSTVGSRSARGSLRGSDLGRAGCRRLLRRGVEAERERGF